MSPGSGKTEAAKALARVLDTPLFRLQCYEGIDAAEALYEWNHPRQLLGIRLAEARQTPLAEEDLFGRDYLLRRPLLQAIEHAGPRPAVLLLDEIDRADAEFEAFTFEVLAEAAVTVPEIGTIRATHPPVVVLTSNRTRDLHDALTRRCLYHWIDYPQPERVAEIVRRRVPGSAEPLALDAAAAVTRLRSLDLVKPPGIAEVIDWVAALTVLGIPRLDAGRGRGQLGLGAQEPRGPRARPGPGSRLAGRRGPCLTACSWRPGPLAVGLTTALHRAGLPASPERAVGLARALRLVPPTDRSALYWTCRVALVTDRAQLPVFDAVFSARLRRPARSRRQPGRPDGAPGDRQRAARPAGPARPAAVGRVAAARRGQRTVDPGGGRRRGRGARRRPGGCLDRGAAATRPPSPT